MDSDTQIGLKPTLNVRSDCRLVRLYNGVKKVWAGTFGCGIFNLFAWNSTTKVGAMGKPKPQINSEHLQGPEISLRNSNDSGGLLHRRWRSIGQNFSSSEIGAVFASISTTSSAMVE